MIARNIGCLVLIGSMISDPHIIGGVSAELGYAGFSNGFGDGVEYFFI